MSSTTIALSRPTLADRVIPRSAVNNALLIVSGTAIVAALAQVEVPMWPVPITGQTLGVMLVGAALGSWRGASSMMLYLVLGLAGLPIFAGGAGSIAAVATPSFGFIIGFVFAAALIGWLSERRWDRHPLLSGLGFLGASLVPFLFGVPYMAFILGTLGIPNDIGTVLALGVYPFILGGVVKWAIAASVLPAAWRLVRAVDEHSSKK
ncbi:biotin transporter BioY [Microbacterium sp. STN6]|uniref:biotin transporter BioY n=1 Tax=Microbacterium sp. STN6 TaxID=2995588 RepID=UPI0022609715|nr:biotin transporter BioY [Microbacterium sp. STN6]MCX7523063.1 biotin transporter BioY [Microbacterium sp. STN6]